MAVALQEAVGRGGLASAHEIGAWVERLAHDDLAKRTARLVELESGRSFEGAPIASAREPDVSTVAVAQANEPTRREIRPLAWTAGALAIAGSAVAMLGLARTRASSLSSTPAPHAVVSESESAPSIASTAGTASPAPAPLPSTMPSPTTPSRTPPASRRATPRSSASPSSCDPPFTYVDGIKTYKSWCYPK
jgi:hypothetical protein